MVRRTGLMASAMVLGATAVVTLFGAANAAADSSRSTPRNSTSGISTPENSDPGDSDHGDSDHGDSDHGDSDHGDSDHGDSDHGDSDHHNSDPGTSTPSTSDHADVRDDVDHVHQASSSPPPPGGESTSDPSPPGDLSTSSNGAAIGGPTVGGRPATTGAGGTEAVSASTAPTPPNGAEPSAAGSLAAAVLPIEVAAGENAVASAPAEESAAAPSASDEASGAIELPDALGDALGATGPRPIATGLSPDANKSGVFVAILALVVLLFLAAHRLVRRSDRGLVGARDAEGVVRFK